MIIKGGRIECWFCCPISELDEAERLWEEEGIDVAVAIHPECKAILDAEREKEGTP